MWALQRVQAPRFCLLFRTEKFCPRLLTAQVLPYLSCPPTASYSQRGHGMFPYKGRGNSWQRAVMRVRSPSLQCQSLCEAGLLLECCCCCWHAWAFLALPAVPARTKRVWKVSVAAQGGPVSLERGCLPNEAVPVVCWVCSEGKSTHPGCLCGVCAIQHCPTEDKSNCTFCLLLLLFAFWSVPLASRDGYREAWCLFQCKFQCQLERENNRQGPVQKEMKQPLPRNA